jgi:hypothetical protein
MLVLIETHREQLAALCRRHHVRRLELFGSAATGLFDPARSDLDFLVEFQTMPPTQHGASYFALWEDLEALFERPVDLVELAAVQNPYFLRGIASSWTLLYAAGGEETLVGDSAYAKQPEGRDVAMPPSETALGAADSNGLTALAQRVLTLSAALADCGPCAADVMREIRDE